MHCCIILVCCDKVMLGTNLTEVHFQLQFGFCDFLNAPVEGCVDNVPLFEEVLLGLFQYTADDSTEGD